MKTSKKKLQQKNRKEQGMAMIIAMMCLLLCSSLGLAVLFNSVGEAALSGGFSRNEQAFYAADAGIGVTRMALRNALNGALQSASATLGANPTLSSRTVGGLTVQTYNRAQLATIFQSSSLVAATGTAITNAKAAVAARGASLTGAGFDVDISLSLLDVSDTSPVDIQEVLTNIWGVNVVQDKAAVTAPVTGRFKYTITATGNNSISVDNPNRAIAKAIESGVIAITLNMDFQKNNGSGAYNRSFSQYGTFLNRWTAGSPLASGTMGGKVHNNQGFTFSSSNNVIFQGDVTQVNSQYQYDSNMYNVSGVSPNSTPRTGLTFNSSFTQTSALPLPSNVYAQELAVVNSTGRADANFPSTDTSDPTAPPKPTATQLAALLKTAANTAPTVTSGALNTGVYLPSDGSSITGGGIYVKGTVDEMTLTVSGTAQVYKIKQGSTTTTITITPPSGSSTGQTSISNGTTTTTYTGVPLDKTIPVVSEYKPSALLYVDGSISSLHGPAASGGTVAAAIAKNTALTITSTGDINVTGSVTYEEPTVNSTGGAVTYSDGHTPTNVLGLFTNTGKITWTPNTTYTPTNANMTVDAAMVAFNEPALASNSSAVTGGWESNCSACSSSTVITLRGSRTVSKGMAIVNNKGEKYNRFFDARFANGALAPPFFPVTKLQNTTTSSTRSFTTYTNQVYTESNTWQRNYS